MKKIVPTLLVGLSLCVAPAAFADPADPFQLSGDVSVKYEKDKGPDLSGTMSTFRLNAEKDLGSGWSLYLRFGAQHATEPALADYLADGSVYSEDKKTVGAIDLFGLNYKKGDMTYRIGRQDLTIGTTALLYSRSDTNIGKHNFVDGVTANGKMGILDVTAVVVREDNVDSADNKLYALRAGYSPNDSVNYGVTLGRYAYKHGTSLDEDGNVVKNEDTNHIAVDGTYKFGRNTLTAELTKSNSNDDNRAYAATWNYGFNDKTALYVTGFRVETNGDMGGQSDFDNGDRGVYYGITHQLSKANSLEVVYKKQKVISSGKDDSHLEATITHAF